MQTEGDKAVAKSASALKELLTFYEKRVGIRVDDAVKSAEKATMSCIFLYCRYRAGILAAIYITNGDHRAAAADG